MSFLTLNGLPVSVAAEAATQARKEIGGSAYRAFSGSLRRHVTSTKRTWRCSTPMLLASDLAAIEGVLLAQGEGFPFDADLYSAKGLAPVASPLPVATLRSAVAADGFPVAGEGKFAGGVAVDTATTNELPADQRDCEGVVAGSFTTVGAAALAVSSTFKWQGLQSIQVITSGVVDGIRGGIAANGIAPGAFVVYAASVYVMSPAAVTLRAFVHNLTTATSGVVKTKTLTPYTWERFTALQPPGFAPGDQLQIHVLENVADSALTFYVDGFQLEQGGGTSTSWVDGVRAAGRLDYPASVWSDFGLDLTINFWLRTDTLGASAGTTLFRSVEDPAGPPNRRLVLTMPTTTSLGVELRAEPPLAGTSLSYTVAAMWPATFDLFRMITLVVRQRPLSAPASGSVVEVWSDGVLKDSRALPFVFDPTLLGPVNLGHNGSAGGQYLNGIFDDLQILPWAATPAQVAGWFAAGSTSAEGPRFRVSGDIVPARDRPVVCEGSVGESYFSAHARNGAWQPSARTTAFLLEEV